MFRVHFKQLWNKHLVLPGFVCPLEALKLLNCALDFTGSFEADECGWPAVKDLEMVPPESLIPVLSVTRMVGLPTLTRDLFC